MLTKASSVPFSNFNFSTPKESLLLLDTNLNVKLAVLPSNDFILAGSSKPGSSTSTLSLPLFSIFGSFVPISSILRLTISNACSCDEVFSSTKPWSENLTFKKFPS